MYFFRLDGSRATRESATVLLEAHFDGARSSREFTSQDHGCFAHMKLDDIRRTFWLGHADTETFGEFSADGFVQKFSTEFQAQFHGSDKLQVEHVYLIGCETGLIHAGTSLAQQIANGLHRNGFINVIVHAIANPPGPESAMIVKVVTSPRYMEELSGEVQAILLTKEQAKRAGELQAELAGFEEKRKTLAVWEAINVRLREYRQIEEKAVLILKTVDIKAELDRPHNCFVPHRPDIQPRKILAQEIALVKMEQIILKIAFAKATQGKVERTVVNIAKKVRHANSDELPQLKASKAQLAQCVDETWRQCVVSARELVAQNIEYHRMLNEVVADAPRLTPSVMAAPTLFAFSAIGAIRNVIQSKKTAVMPVAMRLAITSLDQLANQLETECRKSWFGQSIKQYKASKLRAIALSVQQVFEQYPANPDWLHLIESALKDKKLVQGVFSHRTYDLLQEIMMRSRVNERTHLLIQ